MEMHQREMCALVRGSGAGVGKLSCARIRDLWREWSHTQMTLSWAIVNREHVRWFVAWSDKEPGLVAEASRTGTARTHRAAPPLADRPWEGGAHRPGNTPQGKENVSMMLERVSGQPGAWLRLTGLRPREFQRHLEAFEDVWADHNESRTVRGRHRQKNGRGGRKGAGFGPREMLFFILFYYRHYPMQKTMAALFGLTQQWASLWIKHLTPLAEASLRRRLTPPPRKPATLEQLLAVEPLVLLIAEPQQLNPEQRAGLETLTRLRAALP